MPVATLHIDGADRIVDINPAGEALLNVSAKSARGRPVCDWVVERNSLQSGLEDVRRRNSHLLLDNIELSLDDKRIIEVSALIAPLASHGRHALICIRSRMVEGRIGHGRRSKAAARSAIGMADMLSHEIKNPLTGIQGAAQLLSMTAGGHDHELTTLIVEESQRILKLLEQVEQFGGTGVLDLKSLNVHDILDRACRLGKVGFATAISFETEYDPSLPLVRADEDQALRVFLNLIKNASEALGDRGGVVRIRTYFDDFLRIGTGQGDKTALPIQVEIIDHGPGISEDLAPNIFEPFVSGRKNGTGLGLSLVSAILIDMGGWVAFESRPEHTVFRVSLPVSED